MSQPLLKCLSPYQISFILKEVHDGSCGHHLAGKALALKLLQANYYWPSMIKDSVNNVKKSLKCQMHAHFHVAPTEELSMIMSSWPFNKWGIDLLGHFLLALG